MDFLTSSEPSMSGILFISSSFQLGGMHVCNISGNASWQSHNTVHNDSLYFSSTFNKFRIMPSGKSLSIYNISYKNNTRLPDVLYYLSYVTCELLVVPSGNLYHTNIMLVSKFCLICFIYSQLVTLIFKPMYSVHSASRRQTDSVHAFYQQLCIIKLNIHSSLSMYKWKITYANTYVEMLLFL